MSITFIQLDDGMSMAIPYRLHSHDIEAFPSPNNPNVDYLTSLYFSRAGALTCEEGRTMLREVINHLYGSCHLKISDKSDGLRKQLLGKRSSMTRRAVINNPVTIADDTSAIMNRSERRGSSNKVRYDKRDRRQFTSKLPKNKLRMNRCNYH